MVKHLLAFKSKSRRRKSRKSSKSRKLPCAEGKTRHGTGRCHVKKSMRRRKSRKSSKKK